MDTIPQKRNVQAALLRSIGKARANNELITAAKMVGRSISAINELSGRDEEVERQLLGIEGNASAVYFGALTGIMHFTGRDKDAKDPE